MKGGQQYQFNQLKEDIQRELSHSNFPITIFNTVNNIARVINTIRLTKGYGWAAKVVDDNGQPVFTQIEQQRYTELFKPYITSIVSFFNDKEDEPTHVVTQHGGVDPISKPAPLPPTLSRVPPTISGAAPPLSSAAPTLSRMPPTISGAAPPLSSGPLPPTISGAAPPLSSTSLPPTISRVAPPNAAQIAQVAAPPNAVPIEPVAPIAQVEPVAAPNAVQVAPVAPVVAPAAALDAAQVAAPDTTLAAATPIKKKSKLSAYSDKASGLVSDALGSVDMSNFTPDVLFDKIMTTISGINNTVNQTAEAVNFSHDIYEMQDIPIGATGIMISPNLIVFIIYCILDITRITLGVSGNETGRKVLSVVVAILELVRGNWKKALLTFVGYFGTSPMLIGTLLKTYLT
jgi:hypothetical protein